LSTLEYFYGLAIGQWTLQFDNAQIEAGLYGVYQSPISNQRRLTHGPKFIHDGYYLE